MTAWAMLAGTTGCPAGGEEAPSDAATHDAATAPHDLDSTLRDGAHGETPNAGARDAFGASSPFNSIASTKAYFDGKTVVMEGDDIPAAPLGFDENVNLGSSTQCFHRITALLTPGPAFARTSELGTLEGAPSLGSLGACDRNHASGTIITFETTSVLIENVANDGSCFDITLTFEHFAEQGRGHISADGTLLSLELYVLGQASGHSCAHGAVGSSGVLINGKPFDGDAVQRFRRLE